jgi:hypothetical protein
MTENMLTINKKSMKMPKGAIRIGKSKQDTYLQKDKNKDKKINKILHRKLKIEQYYPN